MQAAHAGGAGRADLVPALKGVDGLVLGPVVLEHATDIRHIGNQPDIAHEDAALEEAVPEMEGQPFHVAAQMQPEHDQRQQMRGHYKKRDGHDQRQAQAQSQMPARKLFLLALGRGFHRTVQGLDAVDQGFQQNRKTPHKGFLEPGMAGQGKPGQPLGANDAVRTAHGKTIGIAVAHHHALHDGLTAHRGAVGRQAGQKGQQAGHKARRRGETHASGRSALTSAQTWRTFYGSGQCGRPYPGSAACR